jgi:hypothetical protein
MNNSLQLLILLLITCSCAKYQYFTVRSELQQNEKGAFVYENDSLKIIYSFNTNGLLNLKIENKLDELIYINWEKSAIVYDSLNLPYSNDQMKIRVDGNTTQLLDINSVHLNGSITGPNDGSYIQPHSIITKSLPPISFRLKTEASTNSYEIVDFGYGKARRYIENDSLNHIKSYLYINNESDSGSTLIQHDFRISQMFETFQKNVTLNSNQFMRTKATGFGNTVIVLGGSAILVLAVISSTDNEE